MTKQRSTSPPASDDSLFPELASTALAVSQSRCTKDVADLAHTTPQGHNAGDLIREWVTWYSQLDNNVPIPRTIIARLAKQVRGLIISGYPTVDIKYGLAIWTVRHADDPRLSPTQLDNITWEWASKTRGNMAAWRREVQQQIASFSGGTVSAQEAPRTRADRQRATDDAIGRWVTQGGGA